MKISCFNINSPEIKELHGRYGKDSHFSLEGAIANQSPFIAMVNGKPTVVEEFSKCVELADGDYVAAGDMFLDYLLTGKFNEDAHTGASNELIKDVRTKKILDEFLSDNGFSIKFIDRLTSDKGVPVDSLVDMVNRVILVSKNEASKDNLMEEIGHVVVGLVENTPLFGRLKSLMEKNSYYKEILGDRYEQYAKEYNNNKDLLVLEAMGQLMGKTISESLPDGFKSNGSQNLARRIWNYVKSIFSKVNTGEFADKIKSEYERVAKDVIIGNKSEYNASNIITKRNLFSISKSRLKFIKKALEESIVITKQRMVYYSKAGRDSVATEEKQRLDVLVESLNRKEHLSGITKLAEDVLNNFEAIGKYIGNLDSKISENKIQDEKKSAKALRRLKAFADSYKEIFENLDVELYEYIGDPKNKNNDDYDKYVDIYSLVENVNKGIKYINKRYIELGTPLLIKFLSPHLGGKNEDLLKSILTNATDDIDMFDRFFTAMSSCNDDVLQLISLSLEKAKSDSRDAVREPIKDIMDAQLALERSGVKDTSFVYQVDESGVPTGYFIDRYDWAKYNEDLNKERRRIVSGMREAYQDLEIPEDYNQVMNYILTNSDLKERFNRSMYEWSKEHTEARPESDDVYKAFRDGMTDEEYKVWYSRNIGVSRRGKQYLKGEMRVPSRKYYDNSKNYDKAVNTKEKKDYYNKVLLAYNKANLKLPSTTHYMMAPQIMKSATERLARSKNFNELKEQVSGIIADTVSVRSDEDEINLGSSTDEFGIQSAPVMMNKPAKFVPIFYKNTLDNMRDLSTNATLAISSYAMMASNYRQMSDISDILELGRDIVDARGVIEKDSDGRPFISSFNNFKEKLSKVLLKPTGAGNTIARIDDYLDMMLYGNVRIKGRDFKVAGKTFNTEKLLDLLGVFTAINGLALNIYAGIQNVLTGRIQFKVEAAASEYYNESDALYAEKAYWSAIPGVMAEMSDPKKSRLSSNKLNLWREYTEVEQEYGVKQMEDANKRTIMSKLFRRSSLFFQTKLGEHYLSSMNSLALASGYRYSDGEFVFKKDFFKELTNLKSEKADKIKNFNKTNLSHREVVAEIKKIRGEYDTKINDLESKLNEKWKSMTNYYDAHEVVGSKFALKEEFKVADDKATRFRFKKKQRQLSGLLNGLYDNESLATAQKYATGRLVFMFRKFMLPGYKRRFAKKHYDYHLEAEMEGYYRTLWNYSKSILDDYRNARTVAYVNWNSMSDLQKKNFRRTTRELLNYFSVILLSNILIGMDWDDDDKGWAANMLCYLSLRTQTEISFYWNPTELLRILQSPSAAVNEVDDVLKFGSDVLQFWNWNDRIERGKYAGETKISRGARKVIPLYNTLSKVTSPETKIKFFTN